MTWSQREASMSSPCRNTSVGPSPPVSSYSIAPADSSIWLIVTLSTCVRNGTSRTMVDEVAAQERQLGFHYLLVAGEERLVVPARDSEQLRVRCSLRRADGRPRERG